MGKKPKPTPVRASDCRQGFPDWQPDPPSGGTNTLRKDPAGWNSHGSTQYHVYQITFPSDLKDKACLDLKVARHGGSSLGLMNKREMIT